MRRNASALCLALAAVAALACDSEARGLGDCQKKVPAEAERLFADVSAAFKRADAAGITSKMPTAESARLYLQLQGIAQGSFAREQATSMLVNHFESRKIVSLMPADGCTTGDDLSLSRTFTMRVKRGSEERDTTLTVELVKKKIDDRTSSWFLGGLKDP